MSLLLLLYCPSLFLPFCFLFFCTARRTLVYTRGSRLINISLFIIIIIIYVRQNSCKWRVLPSLCEAEGREERCNEGRMGKRRGSKAEEKEER